MTKNKQFCYVCERKSFSDVCNECYKFYFYEIKNTRTLFKDPLKLKIKSFEQIVFPLVVAVWPNLISKEFKY